LKSRFLNEKREDALQTFNYLEKNLISIEKDFEKVVKKENKEAEKNKTIKLGNKLIEKKVNIKKSIKLPGERLTKVQFYEKEKPTNKKENKN
jgi:hypothetical protein